MSSFCIHHRNEFPCNTGAIEAVSASLGAGGVALAFCVWLQWKLKKAPRGNDLMNRIAGDIRSGARAFLKTEYTYLAVFVLGVFAVLLTAYSVDPPLGERYDGIKYASCFLLGAILSAASGWTGMAVAVDANVRTATAATHGLAEALTVAMTGGSVMGFMVVGSGLIGLSVMFYLSTLGVDAATMLARFDYAADTLTGFGFGASSMALFARVAGGIYTKAADVGADLVGKVEMDIPEDDIRNPAVTADLVGDNVGDVAGMGADLFESFVGSIIAAVALANSDVTLVLLPFWVSAAGVVAAMGGFFLVRTKNDADQRSLNRALQRAILASSLLVLIFMAIMVLFLFRGRQGEGWRIFGCVAIGLAAGMGIGAMTEYFTSYAHWPTQSIARAGVTGPAMVIVQGLGVGMFSTLGPVLIIVVAILMCNELQGQYGIAMAAVGMLSTLGMTLATDAYGPIADNAGGIAEMAKMPHSVRETTDALDALGNTTAATGKGFAIGSAVLTALSLLNAFSDKVYGGQKVDLNIGEPIVLAGVLIGAMIPFLFASLTMLSVQKTARAIILEVRRQFAEIPGLREGTAEADANKVIAISTRNAVHEMLLPGIYSVLTPLTIGYLIGPRCLMGLLGGAIASGMMLAIMMANAGGAWDNSKKYIEIETRDVGSDAHKACIVGDTVGDPFKDTSGPALNILIKLMSIIALTIAPSLRKSPNDYETWRYGMIPLGLLIASTYAVYRLFWKNDMMGDDAPPSHKDGVFMDTPVPEQPLHAPPADAFEAHVADPDDTYEDEVV